MFKIDLLNTTEIPKAILVPGNHGFSFIKRHLTIKRMQWQEKSNLKNGKTGIG